MHERLSLSPWLAGDPARLTVPEGGVADLLAALDVTTSRPPGVLPLAPRVALVHAITEESGRIAIRFAALDPPVSLAPDVFAADLAVVLTAPLRESGRALRLVSLLRACLSESKVLASALAARTREDLETQLSESERRAGESPLSGEEVIAILGADRNGLTEKEAARRLHACGPNRIERVRRRPLILHFLDQFRSFFAILLWIGAGLAFLARMPQLGWAILAVIVVNGTFSFLQEYRAERAVEMLQALLAHSIGVLRDGGRVRLPVSRVVPGDRVILAEGDQVPADGQLLSAEGLRVDQSPLTGESHPVFKMPAIEDERGRVPRLERHELVFAGSGVVAGSGEAIVTATGMTTEIGTIAHLTQTVPESESPLQREMKRVTRVVTALALLLGLAFFAIGVAAGGLDLQGGFFFALGIIVANVPEGLLPTLTLALAMGVQRMARRKSLVKRLSAVEALGATTVICTDKTGTLTENRMAARAVWAAGKVTELVDHAERGPADEELDALFRAAVLASTAGVGHGDPTEVAIVRGAAERRIDPEAIRSASPLIRPHPFDSFRKRMTLVRESARGPLACVKGAPKETLALCESIRREGRDAPLTPALRDAILADHDRLAADGLRILAVAERTLPFDLARAGAATIERTLTFIGLMALWDPPRPEVRSAIALCRRAGIRVTLVTGDYGLTARAIARQIGLPVRQVVTGEELDRLSPESLHALLAEPGVLFARTSPSHKLAIVSGLKARGEVVAVTGDGVNDAPALKAADTGVAMGLRGSEVAKEAAVMVITDDNFASIVAAIREGRAIYANMGKFVTYIFASNVPELFPFLVSILFGVPLPLTVMQILAVDLGTDMIPALALGAEAPESDLMDRPPRPHTARLLGPRRLAHAYGFLGLAEAVLALGAFFWTYWLAGWRPGLEMAASGDLYRRATTMTLAGIVAAQVGNVFACRTERESVFKLGLLGNPLVLAGIAAEIGILLLLIGLPSLARVFGLAPPHLEEWVILLAFPPAILLLEEARKWIFRRREASRRKR